MNRKSDSVKLAIKMMLIIPVLLMVGAVLIVWNLAVTMKEWKVMNRDNKSSTGNDKLYLEV